MNNLKNLFKSKTKITRILKGYKDWNQLSEVIPFENIVLPAASKMSKPKIYRVMSVNSKGKYIDQFIKVTPKSILVIDEKTNYINYEKLFLEIEEVSAPPSNLEIHMRFCPEIMKTSGFFRNEQMDDQDEIKKFCCHSLQERQGLLEDIFNSTIASPNCKTLQSFQVTKTSKQGKKQERVLRFANDCLMTVDKRVVKNEFHFLVFEGVRIYNDSLFMKIKGEENERLVTTQNPEELKASIEESIKKNQEILKTFAINHICELGVNPQVVQYSEPVKEVLTEEKEQLMTGIESVTDSIEFIDDDQVIEI